MAAHGGSARLLVLLALCAVLAGFIRADECLGEPLRVALKACFDAQAQRFGFFPIAAERILERQTVLGQNQLGVVLAAVRCVFQRKLYYRGAPEESV